MNRVCKNCKGELPLTKNKIGLLVAGKDYCEKCLKARTKVLNRLRDDKRNLVRHYELLKGELALINDLKELIKLGEETELRTNELLSTGKPYWANYDLGKYHRLKKEDKEKPRSEEEFKKEILGEESK